MTLKSQVHRSKEMAPPYSVTSKTDLDEGQKVFYQTCATYPEVYIYVKFHRNLIASFSVTVEQLLTKRLSRERKKERTFKLEETT